MKTREELIKSVLENIEKLPDAKIIEVADYASFLLSKIDDLIIQENIYKLSSESLSWQFLEEDGELYSSSDLKEKYQ